MHRAILRWQNACDRTRLPRLGGYGVLPMNEPCIVCFVIIPSAAENCNRFLSQDFRLPVRARKWHISYFAMLLHRKKLPKTREAVIEWSHRFKKQVTAMKYALTNGVILDGSKDMQPQRGKTVLTDGEIITAIVQDDADLNGYTVIDLQHRYLMPGRSPDSRCQSGHFRPRRAHGRLGRRGSARE